MPSLPAKNSPHFSPKPLPKKIDLGSHIAKLREQEAKRPRHELTNLLLFWGDPKDKEYLPQLKPCIGSATVLLRLDTITTITQLTVYCKQKGVTRVIATSISLLSKLLHWTERKAPSLSNYSGSYFLVAGFNSSDPDIEVVFLQPLKQLVTTSFGKFIASRLISKLTKKEKWFKPSEFKGYKLLNPEVEQELFLEFSTCFLISIDIETLRDYAQIRCLSFTGFKVVNNSYESISVVLPLNSEYNLAVMRKWCWQLKAPKIGQNFKYDLSYLTRYNCPVYNYLYDTATLFHCWYSELPKDLGFLNSFFIRKAVYWKDLAKTNDLYEYYKYNALDTWGTGNCFLAMLLEAPKFALDNYKLEFPLLFPCHLSEMTGIERDMTELNLARVEADAKVEKLTASLNKILAIKEGNTFNVKSPVQMRALFKILGCIDLPSCDSKNIEKAKYRHPFNARILNLVLDIREARTLKEKYLQIGAKAKEFHRLDGTGNRVLYSLNPHGTDTGRLASKEHHFWCGLQIQNIPRGKAVKRTFKADEGFLIAESDLSQAESRDTAYISGDLQLIENVEHSPDFHKSNASMFFGVPFEEVTKQLRSLAKPVNHGANYNMGAYVLIDTMGEANIAHAKQLLKLPKFWGQVQVAEHLLAQFHKTYPNIKKVFYAGVVEEVMRTNKLTSMAWHHKWNSTVLDSEASRAEAISSYEEERLKHPAWVRYCFSNPSKRKPALNAYIAHPPQSLNAQTLNKAYLSVFYDIAMHPKHRANFKLIAQIHDSILFQYRKGHDYLCDMVKERMEVPLTIKGYDNIIRTFVAPAGVKNGKHLKKKCAEYWSETE